MKRKSLDKDLYGQIGINNLLLFSISSVLDKKQKCTFERLVQECFSLFGEVFSFKTLPKWPDSRKLDRPLRTLRINKLITGDPQNFFSLTKTGKKSAEDIAKILSQKKLQI